MKRSIVLTLAMFLSIAAWSQQLSAKETNLKVFFHCTNGKALLEKELSKKEGVYSVNADLETKVVKITYDSTKLNEQRLIEYIHQIGYLTEKSPAGTKLYKACSHEHDESEHKD